MKRFLQQLGSALRREWARVAMVLFGLSTMSAASAAVLVVTPDTAGLNPGQQVSLEVRLSGLDPGQGLGAYELFVDFDPTLLAYRSFASSDALGASTGLELQENAGHLSAFEVSLESIDALIALQPASFGLFTLVFEAIAPGAGLVGFGSASLYDAAGAAISGVTLGAASIRVSPASSVPEPGTLALAAMLVAVAVLRRRWRVIISVCGTFVMLGIAGAAAAQSCDANGDGSVDRRDIDIITAARGQPASGPADPRDADGDGRITVGDARVCATRCSLAQCAIVTGGASSIIGPAGGSVALADGARVDIPAGALAANTTITIREIALPSGAVLPPTGVLASKVYSLEPNGQSFAVPVTVTLPYNPSGLPSGYNEGSITIARSQGSLQFNMVGNANADPEAESTMQVQDPARRLLSVGVNGFSAYAAVGVRNSAAFAPVTLTGPNTSIVVKRPSAGGLRVTRPAVHNCVGANYASNTMGVRGGSAIRSIVLHSTNSGNSRRDFNGELGWATDSCNQFFAHYYLDRTGEIYQVADDNAVVFHTRPNLARSIDNGNAIGIEIFNNVGEPYDGRMIAALIRLLDYLTDRYGIARVAADAPTGIVPRNRASISIGGDAIVAHEDNQTGKCDPLALFMSTAPEVTVTAGSVCAKAVFPGGVTGAPALIDMVLGALAALPAGAQHTGVINTSGGDARGAANPGPGGLVDIQALPSVFALLPSPPQFYADNAALLVAAGQTRTISGGVQQFTDAIIAGTVIVSGDIDMRLTGNLYIAPGGRLVVRRGADGGNIRIVMAGLPVIQGLIDTTGPDSTANPGRGGAGGAVQIYYGSPGTLLVPTLITRGGDASQTDGVTVGVGGAGGRINIDTSGIAASGLGRSVLLVGGGVGRRAVASDPASALPPIRANLDPIDDVPPNYIGERLPAFPPFYYLAYGTPNPVAEVPSPLKRSPFQVGFSRGFLTSGGTGGGATGLTTSQLTGAPGGAGGSIALKVAPGEAITFRNVDLITGADAELAISEILLPETGATRWSYYFATGGLGGKGRQSASIRVGGDGGRGGDAGAISIVGDVVPAPTVKVPVAGTPLGGAGVILGANGQPRPQSTDEPTANYLIGRAFEYRDATGQALYRLRLDGAGNALGGSGGSASGGAGGTLPQFPGAFGAQGLSATITGLPK